MFLSMFVSRKVRKVGKSGSQEVGKQNANVFWKSPYPHTLPITPCLFPFKIQR
jgi:hypothetical protein